MHRDVLSSISDNIVCNWFSCSLLEDNTENITFLNEALTYTEFIHKAVSGSNESDICTGIKNYKAKLKCLIQLEL